MKISLSPLQQGIVSFLESNEDWLRPILVEKMFQNVDLETEGNMLRNPNVIVPEYYLQDFHSVRGGYLNKDAALTYDPITSKILVPSEDMLRTETAARIPKTAKKVLDIGCGTGTATRAIATALPESQVTGVDLSPYMLAAAKMKAKSFNNISFLHANATELPFENESFDAVSASLLFHEMPKSAGELVIKEVLRVLKPGGTFTVFDGAQYNGVAKLGGNISSTLFLEPYAEEFLASNLAEMMSILGFKEVESTPIVVFYEIRQGIKS
ncbi:MAG: class I SAM-dependent methyltransferase [Chloroherpetonaceae bacterium]|nr:class I SAM-dependent methyltransferase [Chloroherpetonaceae bacterium]